MGIINSLKNKNVKKYIIIAILTTILLNLAIFFGIKTIYDNERKQVLNKYEVEQLDEEFALEEIDKKLYDYVYIVIGINVFITVIITIYFLCALNKNEQEIKKMRDYLKEIANKNYQMDTIEISESEISNFRSELYKIVLELKEKTQNLANDRETLSNYLADISHQLRTPLMAITVMTDAIIENKNNLDKSTQKFINEISSQLDRMNWLVDSLLKMAQLDIKTVVLNREKVNLRNLVEIIERNMSIFLKQKNQVIDNQVDNDICFSIDKKWMIEAIENIIKNCIEYSKENSTIVVNGTKNPLYTEISIKDSGKGISKKDLPRIFDKFYKGENSSSNSFGIGLAFAKNVVESHSGEITAISKESEETTFIIKLYNS